MERMYYAIGTHIDLSHLNKTPIADQFEKQPRRLFPVGTRIIFNYIDGISHAAIKIPVTAV